MVDRGLLVAASHPLYAAEVVQGLSFIVPVADLTGEGEGLLKTIGCRPVTASPYQRKAEIVQRGDLPELVADLAEDRQRPPQSLISFTLSEKAAFSNSGTVWPR